MQRINASKSLVVIGALVLFFSAHCLAVVDIFVPGSDKQTGELKGTPMTPQREAEIRKQFKISSDAQTGTGIPRDRAVLYRQPLPYTPCTKIENFAPKVGTQYLEINLDHDSVEAKIRKAIEDCGRASLVAGIIAAYVSGGNVEAAGKAFFVGYKACMSAFVSEHYNEVFSARTACEY